MGKYSSQLRDLYISSVLLSVTRLARRDMSSVPSNLVSEKGLNTNPRFGNTALYGYAKIILNELNNHINHPGCTITWHYRSSAYLRNRFDHLVTMSALLNTANAHVYMAIENEHLARIISAHTRWNFQRT